MYRPIFKLIRDKPNTNDQIDTNTTYAWYESEVLASEKGPEPRTPRPPSRARHTSLNSCLDPLILLLPRYLLSGCLPAALPPHVRLLFAAIWTLNCYISLS